MHVSYKWVALLLKAQVEHDGHLTYVCPLVPC